MNCRQINNVQDFLEDPLVRFFGLDALGKKLNYMSELALKNKWKFSARERVVVLGSTELKDMIDGSYAQYEFVGRIQAFIETTSDYIDKTRGVTMFEDFLRDGSVSIDLKKYTLMEDNINYKP